MSRAGGGTYKVQISPVDISGITDIGAALLAEVDNERQTGRAAPIPPVDKEPVSTYAKPVFDAKLVEDFLKGDHCLTGVSQKKELLYKLLWSMGPQKSQCVDFLKIWFLEF